MDPKDRIRLPADTVTGQGNCGVVALAVFLGLSYQETEWRVRKAFGKPMNWKGSMRFEEIKAMLRKYNRRRSTAFRTRKNVRRKTEYPTLQQWVRNESWPGTVYYVLTTGHAQIVCDGYVTDQCGTKHVTVHQFRRKRALWACALK